MDSPMNGETNHVDSSDDNGNRSGELVNGQQAEPDSTTNGYPDELEELIRRSLNGSASADSTDLNDNENAYHHTNGHAHPSGDTCDGEAAAVLDKKELDELNRIISSDHAEDGQVVIDGFELPKSLIITNIDSQVFQIGTEERNQFEETFRAVDSSAIFFYFRSFRRARVDFAASVHATKARILCNQKRIGEEAINVYYAEITEVPAENRHLRPPALEKQFLISPPASPPEGWEPSEEAQPVLNIDLQSALANLLPGTSHELHAATDDQPGIFVHICPDTTITTTIDQNIVSSASKDIDDDEDDGEAKDVTNFGPNIELVTLQEECMSSEDSTLTSMSSKGSPSFQIMGNAFSGMHRGSLPGASGMSRKIPHTACPPSMSSLASSARREDN